MKTLFVWDFHGTLEKDNVLACQILTNQALRAFNVNKQLDLDETTVLYGLSWIDFFKYAYPEGDLRLWRKMKDKAVEIQARECIVEKYIKQMDHADEVLAKTKKAGHSNIILSNTQSRLIKGFVEMVNLDKYIDDYIAVDLHNFTREGKDVSREKIGALKKYIKDNKFNKIVKIGDRDSDILVGKALNGTTYYLRTKYNKNHKVETDPDYIINDLREILRELR
ncbi:HAD hydrolase-like protein [Patescibacteria group bacterium]|nr:HAD hydrolase-like protein [Patescibacteria group bacterium]MBU1890832.1 HAD hydrolase-like protein [Patescibacteria group bacterium]